MTGNFSGRLKVIRDLGEQTWFLLCLFCSWQFIHVHKADDARIITKNATNFVKLITLFTTNNVDKEHVIKKLHKYSGREKNVSQEMLINKKTGEFPAFLYMYMLEIDYPKICQISIYLRCSCSIFFIVSCAVFSPERLINLL